MALNTPRPQSPRETSSVPTYYDGSVEIKDDVRLHARYYVQNAGDARLVGCVVSIAFRLDRLAKDVWPYFKDSNLWHNCGGYHYSGVLGDLEGKTFRISPQPNEAGPHQYRVVKVIPEHLIVWEQPGPWDGGPQQWNGYGVYMLNEHDGKTFVNVVMQHAIRAQDQTDEEAMDFWRGISESGQLKWRDFFIPTLKRLIAKDPAHL